MSAEGKFEYRIFIYGLIIGLALGTVPMYILLHSAARAGNSARIDNITAVYITYFNNATGRVYSSVPLNGFNASPDSVYNYSFVVNYYNNTYNETITAISTSNNRVRLYGIRPELPITIQKLGNATINLLLTMPNSTYTGQLNLTITYHKDIA